MTITNEKRAKRHQGNGSATEFPYDFFIPDAESVDVILYDTVAETFTELSGAQYDITGIGSENFGEVTYPLTGDPIASTVYLIIRRTVPYTQTQDINNQGGFLPEIVTDAFDRTVMQTQQLAEQVSRAMLVVEGDAFTKTLPLKSLLEDRVLAFDGDGEPTVGPTATEVGNAQGYANAASASADSAASSASDAADAADLAEDWASAAEDQEVDGGEFSAKHYAAKAAKSAGLFPATGASVDGTTIFYNHSATGYETGDGARVFPVLEQPGADDYSKLAFALEGKVANGKRIVHGSPSLDISLGSSQGLTVLSRTVFDGRRMKLTGTGGLLYPVTAEDDGELIAILNLIVDAGGATNGKGIRGTGVQGFVVEGCEVFNWALYGIDAVSATDSARPAMDVRFNRNRVHTPAAGASFAMVIRSGADGAFVTGKNEMNWNWCFGDDPLNPASEPEQWDGSNAWTADQMVAQGVENLDFIGNYSGMSGAAAWSLTRGCRNVRALLNTADRTREASNYGSNWEAVKVADISGFIEDSGGDTISTDGTFAISSGNIQRIVPDTYGATSGPGWLRCNSVGGGTARVGDNITQSSSAETEEITDVRYSVEDLEVGWNRMLDVGAKNDGIELDSDFYAAINMIRCRGETGAYVHDNHWSDPRGIGNCNRVIHRSRSDIGHSNNQPSAKHLFTSGDAGDGSWLWQDEGGLQEGHGDTLTINGSGVITPMHKVHRVDTASAAAEDDLLTVATDNVNDGDIVTLIPFSNARTVVAKDTGGNMRLPYDLTLDDAQDALTLQYFENLSAWVRIGGGQNAGPILQPGFGPELTIASGSITPTHENHTVDTESNDASDDLTNVVTTNIPVGGTVRLFPATNSRAVVCKDAGSNMRLPGDVTLDNVADNITLVYDGSNLICTGTQNNG